MAARLDSDIARDERRRKLVVVLALAVLLAVVLAVGFYLGQLAVHSGMGKNPMSFRALRGELFAARDELAEREAELEAELEVLRTRHAVDRAALEIVRSDLAANNEEIASLEEGLNFYRSLMAPGDLDEGLSIRSIELVAGAEPQHVSYRVVLLQQQSGKHQMVNGKVSVTVVGVMAGETHEYPLSALSDDIEDSAIAMSFRYFQSVEGELTIPEGFEPHSVHVVASATTPSKIEIGEDFPWQLQERFTHVGK